ncbi:hypothetical protein [Rubrivirga sp.]|uniref:hypothetical protein n=1 Tax=Rubrivirga sp. TaxID=1885344 RepID=UPI003B5245E2
MPQFEVQPHDQPSVFVRARTDLDAVRRHLTSGAAEVALAEAEAGSGWRAVAVDGDEWGRVRPRDRMRFRRD